MYHFIWNGKDKIKRSAIINEIENGGLIKNDSFGNRFSSATNNVPEAIRQ